MPISPVVLNLRSAIRTYDITTLIGHSSKVGIVSVYESLDGGTTYSSLLSSFKVHTGSVWYSGSDSVVVLDLVKLLRGYLDPVLVGDMKFVIKFKVTYTELVSGASEVDIDLGTFYNSLEDSCVDRFITRKYVGGYSFPISYIGSKVVVVNGISYSLSSAVGKSISYVPTSGLSIDGNVFEKLDSGYQLCYINSHGTWSVFVPNGASYRSDSKSFESTRVWKNLNGLRSVNSHYNERISSSYEVNSGWLDEGQSAMLAKDLLESPFIMLYCSDYPDGVVVTIDDSNINYMDRHKDSVMNYTFVVKTSEEIRK